MYANKIFQISMENKCNYFCMHCEKILFYSIIFGKELKNILKLKKKL